MNLIAIGAGDVNKSEGIKKAIRRWLFRIQKTGGGTQEIGEHFHAHDFIELSPRTPARITEKCAHLYEQGLSLRDIEERTGIPKTSIRETLTKSGMALRNPLNGNAKKIDSQRTKRGGHTAFGYAYLDGKLVIDPKEQIALRKILKLHQAGKSNQAIANELNHLKVPTRSGKPWIRSVIHSIIQRAKKTNPMIEGSHEKSHLKVQVIA